VNVVNVLFGASQTVEMTLIFIVYFHRCFKLPWHKWLVVYYFPNKVCGLLKLSLCHCSIPELPEEVNSCRQHWKCCSYWKDCDTKAYVTIYSIQLDAYPS